MRSVFVEGGCFDIFLLCCCCCFFVDYFTTFPAFSPSLLFQLVLIFGFVCLHNFHRTDREKKTEITTFFLEFSLLPYEVRDRFVGALKQRCDDDEKRQFSKKGIFLAPAKPKRTKPAKYYFPLCLERCALWCRIIHYFCDILLLSNCFESAIVEFSLKITFFA